MNVDKVFNVAALIVGLAIVATLVASKNTASIVKSVGDSFSGSIRAAKH